MNSFRIREIKPGDNQQIAALIRAVLVEMGVPETGTAYEDKSLDDMFSTYNKPRMKFYVVEEDEKLIGGAGIAPLSGEAEGICELQKMYFLPEARGRGIGAKMMNACLNFARTTGFRQCYLETLPYMEGARKLYAKSGFKSLGKSIGDTGHYNCTMWMLKDL